MVVVQHTALQVDRYCRNVNPQQPGRATERCRPPWPLRISSPAVIMYTNALGVDPCLAQQGHILVPVTGYPMTDAA